MCTSQPGIRTLFSNSLLKRAFHSPFDGFRVSGKPCVTAARPPVPSLSKHAVFQGAAGMRVRGRSNARGFTLVEVMVALFIVAFAFVGLLGLHNRNLAAVGHDQDLALATLLARRLITEMELVEQFPDLGFSSGEIQGYPGFRWEREVKEVTFEGATIEDLREVRFRVIWDERIPDACRLVYYIRDRREPEL